MRSMASGEAEGTIWLSGVATNCGNLKFIRRAEDRANLGSEREHLTHDGSDGPDVDRRRVRWRAQQHLGRAVPSRGDIVGVGWLGADLSGQTEVSHLERVSGDKHVLRLDVPVEEAVLVHVGERLQHLIAHVAHLGLGKVLLAVLAELVEIHVKELEDEVEYVVLADDLLELDDVGVAHLAEALHLAQLHALLPRVKLLLHALDRDNLAARLIDRLHD
eukprot:scaffold65805_cov31-Tisochrysis_lutea.AAC.3